MVLITKVCWGNQYNVKIELYDAANSRKTSRENDNLMELPSDVGSPSVDGIVLDPVPEWRENTGIKILLLVL